MDDPSLCFGPLPLLPKHRSALEKTYHRSYGSHHCSNSRRFLTPFSTRDLAYINPLRSRLYIPPHLWPLHPSQQHTPPALPLSHTKSAPLRYCPTLSPSPRLTTASMVAEVCMRPVLAGLPPGVLIGWWRRRPAPPLVACFLPTLLVARPSSPAPSPTWRPPGFSDEEDMEFD